MEKKKPKKQLEEQSKRLKIEKIINTPDNELRNILLENLTDVNEQIIAFCLEPFIMKVVTQIDNIDLFVKQKRMELSYEALEVYLNYKCRQALANAGLSFLKEKYKIKTADEYNSEYFHR